MSDTQTTEIALLPPAERAQIVLASTKTEQHLKSLIEEAGTINEVLSKDDREQAHRVGMKLKNARTSIEKAGKAAREDAQAFSKAVIEEEKRLKAITADEEERVFKLRDGYDAKVEARKAEAERIERERVAALRAKIEGFRALPLQSANDTAEQINETYAELQQVPVNQDTFAELVEEAFSVKANALIELGHLYSAAKSREAAEAAVASERSRLKEEADRLAEERAEIERMKAELEAAKKAIEPPVAPTLGDVLGAAAPAPIADMFGANQTIDTPDEAEAKNARARAMLDAGDLAAGGDQSAEYTVSADGVLTFNTPPENGDYSEIAEDQIQAREQDADAIVSEIARYTAMQFFAIGRKVAAVAENSDQHMKAALMGFSNELRSIGRQIADGEFNQDIKAGNWFDMAEADKELALASHACVSLIIGDDEMGASALRSAA